MSNISVNLDFLSSLEDIEKKVETLKEKIITNIIMVGQEPNQNMLMKDDDVAVLETTPRASIFAQRLSDSGLVDEVSTDSYGNPIGLIKGTGGGKPIIIAAHLDSANDSSEELNYSVTQNRVMGEGIIDNTCSAGIIVSIPEILNYLDIRFESDLYLIGFAESLGRKNLKGVRNFLSHWNHKTRGAVILEGTEIGRLNYYSRGMIRGEVNCIIPDMTGWEHKFGANAIIILNEVINRIMNISLPQRPRTQVTIGRINGGMKYGDMALKGMMGLEILSDSFQMVEELFSQITDIVESLAYENQVEMSLDKISNVGAYSLGYNHPLVKSSVLVMEALGLKPKINSSESELSIFLAKNIPTVTIGMTHGEKQHTEDAFIELEPLYNGIAQLVGILKAIDSGVCDE